MLHRILAALPAPKSQGSAVDVYSSGSAHPFGMAEGGFRRESPKGWRSVPLRPGAAFAGRAGAVGHPVSGSAVSLKIEKFSPATASLMTPSFLRSPMQSAPPLVSWLHSSPARLYPWPYNEGVSFRLAFAELVRNQVAGHNSGVFTNLRGGATIGQAVAACCRGRFHPQACRQL